MSELRMEIGNRYEPMSDERREAAQELVDELSRDGFDVELEIVGYKPGRRALSPVEWTSIFIGTNVATTLVVNITTDVYNRMKRMLLQRKRSKSADLFPGRPLGFVIYGPRGEELRRWTTEEEVGTDGSDEADGDDGSE
jgi:hypothetical protein